MRACKHPWRLAPGYPGEVCRNCPLLAVGSRARAFQVAIDDTQPIPVYPSWEPRRLDDTQPIPVIRDGPSLQDQINERLGIREAPLARRQAKSIKIPVEVWALLVSLILAIILYQIPIFGHG